MHDDHEKVPRDWRLPDEWWERIVLSLVPHRPSFWDTIGPASMTGLAEALPITELLRAADRSADCRHPTCGAGRRVSASPEGPLDYDRGTTRVPHLALVQTYSNVIVLGAAGRKASKRVWLPHTSGVDIA
jgi:hypothetical protein